MCNLKPHSCVFFVPYFSITYWMYVGGRWGCHFRDRIQCLYHGGAQFYIGAGGFALFVDYGCLTLRIFLLRCIGHTFLRYHLYPFITFSLWPLRQITYFSVTLKWMSLKGWLVSEWVYRLELLWGPWPIRFSVAETSMCGHVSDQSAAKSCILIELDKSRPPTPS